MSEKHKKECKYLNYVEHLLTLASAVTGCVSTSAFASLVCIPVGITSSAVGLKMCAINGGFKKKKIIDYKEKSIIKKKMKKHDNLVLLRVTKLDTIEVLMSKTLINLYISHDDLFQ